MQRDSFSSIKKSAISIGLAVALVTGAPALGCLGQANAAAVTPALPDVSVLISGPPIKDPGALLRYALPIDNKAIREVQKPLEDITDSLKIAGVKALDSVERVRNPTISSNFFLHFVIKGWDYAMCLIIVFFFFSCLSCRMLDKHQGLSSKVEP